jgi:putative ABC transport system ATP-binding protein
VLLDGVDLGGLDDDRRAELRLERIGFVFQQYNLLPIFTALENVALPLRLAGIHEVEAARRAEEALAVVEMSSRRDQIPSHLSGGEQQRVAIARAVVGRPAMVLADEPTGALDTKNGELVIDVLRRLVDERGQTVVMVTHDAAVAARADRVITLRDGRVESDLEPRRSAPVAAGAEGPRE